MLRIGDFSRLSRVSVKTLRYYDEMSYEEIAYILKTSVGGLKANYFHALRKVQRSLKHALTV